ncbi:hypothetical protein LCGC14_2747080 [marine sediment metagenome]|uniref:Uncharacterized protein n=1 Tax=marine sediment metagenome TaxID=412755 RepID=A0A0F8Z2Y4_9ZZZZ
MGQYFRPINIKTMEWIKMGFWKLTEHSWIGNRDVGKVMTLLSIRNPWYKSPIAWCGDYYDEKGEINYYDKLEGKDRLSYIKPMSKSKQLKAILINHTKREYVVYSKIRVNKWELRVNPLPILTALGNGRGQGDYRDYQPDFDKVGIWAGDIFSVRFIIPKGYKELEVDFYEE